MSDEETIYVGRTISTDLFYLWRGVKNEFITTLTRPQARRVAHHLLALLNETDDWQQTVDEMRLASDLCDESNGTSDYTTRLVALALVAREFLRRFPAHETTQEGR